MGSQTRRLRRLDETNVVPGCSDYPSPQSDKGMQVVRVLEYLTGLGDMMSDHEYYWLSEPPHSTPDFVAKVRETLALAEAQVQELERVLGDG